MAAPWVTGLASGAGALAGLVIGGYAGMKLSEHAQTPDQRTAGVALGAAVGMFSGAFALATATAEPGPASAPAGTAGIPEGLGAPRQAHKQGRVARGGGAVNSQLSPGGGAPRFAGMGKNAAGGDIVCYWTDENPPRLHCQETSPGPDVVAARR
jgi:hypothetical protein